VFFLWHIVSLRLHWGWHLDLKTVGWNWSPLYEEKSWNVFIKNVNLFSTEERMTWTSSMTWGWENYQQKFFQKWTTPLSYTPVACFVKWFAKPCVCSVHCPFTLHFLLFCVLKFNKLLMPAIRSCLSLLFCNTMTRKQSLFSWNQFSVFLFHFNNCVKLINYGMSSFNSSTKQLWRIRAQQSCVRNTKCM